LLGGDGINSDQPPIAVPCYVEGFSHE
jgi:hypothetical protein